MELESDMALESANPEVATCHEWLERIANAAGLSVTQNGLLNALRCQMELQRIL